MKIDYDAANDCPACNGAGRICDDYIQDADGWYALGVRPCPRCQVVDLGKKVTMKLEGV